MGRRGGKGDGEGGEGGLGEEVAARVWERGGTEGALRGCSFGGSCVCSGAGCLGTLGGSCVSAQETEVGGEKGRGVLGRGEAGGRTGRGGKGKGTQIPVNTRVVASEPRKPQHQLKMSKKGKVKGKVFCMACMNTEVGSEIVGYGSSSWIAAVY